MSKSEEMKKVLDSVSDTFQGPNRSTALKTNKCVMCGKDATKFRDAISMREYFISGICQDCQDKFFGE